MFRAYDQMQLMKSGELTAIRDHWALMQTEQLQTSAVHQMFYYIFRQHPHMRPIWVFGRTWMEDEELEKLLPDNEAFNLHSEQFRYAVSFVCATVNEDPKQVVKTLEEVGSHHFFYDTYEPHLEVLEEGMMHALSVVRPNGMSVVPETTMHAWREMFRIFKMCFAKGISDQRKKYLTQCITKKEVEQLNRMWSKIEEFGKDEMGRNLCGGALRAYEGLIKQAGLNFPINVDVTSDDFKEYSSHTIAIVETAIHVYSRRMSEGDKQKVIAELPSKLKPYVDRYALTDVCPSLVRKAFMEGLMNMLTYVLGEVEITDNVQRIWMKLYRVMEQAIIATIVSEK